MAGEVNTMTFLAFPREVLNLIYTHLATKNETYSIAATNVSTMRPPSPNRGIINSCKIIQYEMLEMLWPRNTFRFSFPCSDTNAQSLFHVFAPRLKRIEFYIDFSSFPWQSFRIGRPLDPEIRRIGEQVCEAISTWNEHPLERESCRIIISDNTRFVSSLLQLRIFEVMKTLSRVETVLIIMLKFKSDLRKLGALLRPSLGPSTVHYMWPSLPDFSRDYGCIKYHPRKFLAEMNEHVDEKVTL